MNFRPENLLSQGAHLFLGVAVGGGGGLFWKEVRRSHGENRALLNIYICGKFGHLLLSRHLCVMEPLSFRQQGRVNINGSVIQKV